MDRRWPKRVKGDSDTIRKDAGGLPIPADAVTTSGSGLDPEVSPDNATCRRPASLAPAASR